MMRTFKRPVSDLSIDQDAVLGALIRAFNAEKAHWLRALQGYAGFGKLANIRKQVRDPAVRANYVSSRSLSARLWKLALDSAAGMADRHWQAHFVTVRRTLHAQFTAGRINEAQRHYCHSILCDYGKLHALFHGQLPALPKAPGCKKQDPPATLEYISKGQQIEAAYRLRSVIRKKEPEWPRVKLARSVVLDHDCYRITSRDGIQIASIATLVRGKRLALPLKGFCATPKSPKRTHRAPKKTDHYGTICIVRDQDCVALHATADTESVARNAGAAMTGEILALDAGYTDTFADQHGRFYGSDLGSTLRMASDALHDKGVARNRLSELAYKYRRTGQTSKANAIRRFNLGRVKHVALRIRQHATVDCIINTAVNNVMKQKPATVVREQFSGRFTFDLGRQTNRRLSAWTRGRIVERTEWKLNAGGIRSVLVNASYSSQECSQCGWVEQSNRNGHDFKCRKCRHAAHAGKNAARNLLKRSSDDEITLHTPYPGVKRILIDRYDKAEKKRQMETPVPARAGRDCTGQTIDPVARPQAGDKRASVNGEMCEHRINPAGDHRANNG